MSEVEPVLSGTVSDGDPELVYQRLVEAGRDVVNRTSWMLGDLALKAQKVFGEDVLLRFANDIGAASQTIYNARSVAKAFPEHQRPEYLSFSVAKVLAPYPDRHDLVREYPNMTVREAKDLVKARMDATVPPRAIPEESAAAVRRLSRTLREYADQISPEHYAEILDRAANKARKVAKQLEKGES